MQANDGIRLDLVPPQNIDAERAVLGSMMHSTDGSEAIAKVLDVFGSEEETVFYREAHRTIFRAILNLFERGEPVDLLTVTKELERLGETEKVGGVSYLDELQDSIPTVINADYYAGMVKEDALRRKLIHTASKIYYDAFNDSEDIKSLLNQAEYDLLTLRKDDDTGNTTAIKHSLKDTFKRITDLYNRGEGLLGLPTGFHGLDEITSGFQPGDYIVVGGRPGMGKSTWIQNVIEYVAIEEKRPVLLFTLETSKSNFTFRMLSSQSMVKFDDLRRGKLKEWDWGRVTIAAGRISESPIFINDETILTPLAIRSKCHRAVVEHGVQLIVIDYMQLMDADKKCNNRQEEISHISRGLKSIARDLNVPVVVASQLNRSTENRGDQRPQLSDLRESGAIEQDTDLVLFLFRESYYERGSGDAATELIIGKHKNGSTGVVNLGFDAAHMKFKNL